MEIMRMRKKYLARFYGSFRRTFLFPISSTHLKFQLNALYIPIKDAIWWVPIPIYNKNQEPNQTGNISLTLDSKRRLVVLVLWVLLSNKNSLETAQVPKMEIGIRNWTHQLGP